MGHRYTAWDGFYKGTRFIDELESLGEKLACEVFGSDWASLRPLSGHIADTIMVSTLTKPGGSILTVNPSNGGYDGLGNRGYPPFVNVKNLFFPYDSERMNIDVERAKTFIEFLASPISSSLTLSRNCPRPAMQPVRKLPSTRPMSWA